jgi:hypothetical protein
MQHDNKKPSRRTQELALTVAGNVLAGLILFYIVRLLT